MEEIEELDLEIRLATSGDFDILTDISRICYPEQLRWKTFKSHNRKWWDLLINSQYCEMYVCSIYGQVVAYIALVFDKIKYEDTWENQRLGVLDILYIFANFPIQFLKRTYTKFQQKRNRKPKNTGKQSKKKRKPSTYEMIRKHFAENTPWLGPYAVLPSMRGKGIATQIHEYCFQRSKELGYKSAYAAVKVKNTKSKDMVNKLGFKTIGEVDHVVFYKKNLGVK